MFKRLVRRNLVALMIPVIIIELMVLYMSMQLSLLDEYRCYKVSDLSSVGILYKEGEQNITFDYSGGSLKKSGRSTKRKALRGRIFCYTDSCVFVTIKGPGVIIAYIR